MSNRRQFLGGLISAAGVAASGQTPTSRIVGANDRVRFGLIGAGARGTEDFGFAVKCNNVEAVAVADIYAARFTGVMKLAPNMKTYLDFRRLLDDKSIDAVLIVTPQHNHCLNFVPAIQAGKDVYQEKTMAFTPNHARRMKHAFQGSGRVVQIGMQMNSGPGFEKARGLATKENLGSITALQAFHFRNSPYGGWMRQVPADCDAAHVDWTAFQGEAKSYPFDPQRYMNWRFYWDYSGGNVFENMVHQVGFWYGALNWGIPEAVTMVGADYLAPNMHVPDTMSVTMQQPEKVLFTWNSMFGNAYFGEGYDLLFGNVGTLIHDQADNVALLPQRRRAPRTAAAAALATSAPAPVAAPPAAPATAPPIGAGGYHDFTTAHLQNFFDCVRSRKDPVCPFDLGYRVAIACQMAIASYRQQRTVRWDPETEDIV
jgi:predicted dehydrogenase